MPVTGQLLIPLSNGADTSEIEHIEIFESIAERIRNKVQALVEDYVPTMVSASSPPPWVITDSGWTTGAWSLFKDARAYVTFVNPTWVKVDSGTGITVDRLTIKNFTETDRAPKDFQLWGSQTEAFTGEHTVLATWANISWAANEKKIFTFTNVTSYRYYRLNITAITGNLFVDLQQMELGRQAAYPASVSPAAVWKATDATKIKWSTARVAIYKNGTIQAATSTDFKCQKAVNNGSYNGTFLTLSGLRALSDDTITDATNSVKVLSQYNSDTSYEVKTPMFMVVDVEYPTGGGVIIIDEGVMG